MAMHALNWILAVVLLAGCGGETATKSPAQAVGNSNRPLPKSAKFFSDWLQNHGHSDVLVDAQGVGVKENPTRLSASLYGSNGSEKGFVVETEFRIQLGSGREIIEFVAGLGETEDQAVRDSFINFLLTTFHPVYKSFINADDPHLVAKSVEFPQGSRTVIFGDVFLRGEANAKNPELWEVQDQIAKAISSLRLSPDAHWIKIVYGQSDGRPSTVSGTIDNLESPDLAAKIYRLNWPQQQKLYMLKQFIVILPARQ